MKWTEPGDLKSQVTRLWENGYILGSLITEEATFPKRLRLKGPSSRDFTHAFPEVRKWCVGLSAMKHVRLVHREIHHRVTGSNTFPAEAWIERPEDAVALLGKEVEWKRFQNIVETTRHREPGLLPWLANKPLRALDNAEDWERFLDLANWIRMHPRPGCYLRQVDLPGIHTKFIERNRGLLAELFDLLLPEQAIDASATGGSSFCARYGFRDKPERLRLRPLDPAIDPLRANGRPDLTLDVETLAQISNQPKWLFITENEINFLAFPDVPDAWILFGAGYGFGAWSKIDWFHRRRLFYWGDIDTHGFAALDELRAHFPSVQSFLMDHDTLLAHRNYWSSETSPCARTLGRLNHNEASLYTDLQTNRLGRHIRLEQERISFEFLTNFLSKIAKT